jgi:hypothetical protein
MIKINYKYGKGIYYIYRFIRDGIFAVSICSKCLLYSYVCMLAVLRSLDNPLAAGLNNPGEPDDLFMGDKMANEMAEKTVVDIRSRIYVPYCIGNNLHKDNGRHRLVTAHRIMNP